MSVLDDQSREQLRRQGATLAGIVGKKAKDASVVSATVSRIDDDGTVWVSIGDAEAPAAPGMRASVGDKVSVRLSDGTATITDNRTRPATDDATALVAQETALGAQSVAVDAQEVAEMAAEVAGAIGQHFWTDEAGVHVSTDEGDPAGQRNSIFNSLGLIFREGLNNLMGLVSGSVVGGSDSDRGMAIFDGLGNAASNVIAWFGRNGIRIGKANAQHVEITAQGISITNGTTAGTVNGVDVVQTNATANAASTTANAANTTAGQAKTAADQAKELAQSASSTANAASSTASAASTTASNAADAAAEAQALVKASYGTSSTAASTQTKAVTCSDFSLFAGALVTVKFSTASTYSNLVKLNVNSTGAKDVWVANAATSASNLLLWGAGASITFRYDGTQYQVVGDPRSWYGKCSIAAGTAAKTDGEQVATGAVVCKGATASIGMANANTNTAPTLNIAGTGAKALYAGNGTDRPTTANGFGWAAGSTVDFVFDGQYWRVGDTAALANAKAAQDDATSALTQANATKENFWADSGGVHVSTQANTAAGTYNSLFASTGLLFRKQSNNLVSLTKSALNFYDGSGNADANVTASYGADSVRIGKVGSGKRNVFIDADGVHVRDNTTDLALFGDVARIGKVGSGQKNVYIDGNSVKIRDNTAVISEFGERVVLGGNGANVLIGNESTSFTNAIFDRDSISFRVGTENKLVMSSSGYEFVLRAKVEDTGAGGDGNTYGGRLAFTTDGYLKPMAYMSMMRGDNYSTEIASVSCTVDNERNGGLVSLYGDTVCLGGAPYLNEYNKNVGGVKLMAHTEGGRKGEILWAGGGKRSGGDAAGTVVGLGAGGLTLVGGGEYARNRYNVADLNDTAEQLYLGSDNDVYIETNGNTIANRKTFRFAAGGFFLMPTGGIIEADKRIDLGDRSVSGIDYHARLETSQTGTLHLIPSSGGYSSSNTARGDFALISDGRLGVRKHDGTDWVSGWAYYDFTSAATLRSSIGAEQAGTCLPLSGGTMTGSIRLSSGYSLFAKNTTHDVAASSLSAQTDQNGAVCLDKNDLVTASFLARQLPTGEVRGILQARHNNASGTAVWNGLQLGVKPDGTRTVTLNDPAPWLSALGLGSTTTASSGVVTAASGWTVVLQSLASWGRVRMLHLRVKNAEATSGTRKVATLAAAHKPKGPDAAIATMYSPTTGSGYINTSGEIYIGGSLAANTEWNGMFVWLV